MLIIRKPRLLPINSNNYHEVMTSSDRSFLPNTSRKMTVKEGLQTHLNLFYKTRLAENKSDFMT